MNRFVYGSKPNVPDYMIQAGTNYQILSDANGSVRLVVNSLTGVVAEQMDYDEFGRVINDTNPGFQPFAFAGCLYDNETKFCHFGARDYDPSTGRWLSKDPIRFAGGDTNLYDYVMLDPINKLDITGTFCEAVPSAMKDTCAAAKAACGESYVCSAHPTDNIAAAVSCVVTPPSPPGKGGGHSSLTGPSCG